MGVFESLGKKKVVLGLVHLKPMPGTPFYEEGDFEESLDKALHDAVALYKGGADGCLVQTVDRVYPTKDEADPARIAGMAVIVREVVKATGPGFQVGVQIMRNALKASLAVAYVCGGSYLRMHTFVGATLTGHGFIEANPYDFQMYRKTLGAQQIKLIAEIQGMHMEWFGGKPVGEIARMAQTSGAHAVEVAHPDEDTNAKLVREVKKAVPNLPVILGGHTNHENAARRLAEADGAFVGTCLESEGWGSRIDIDRVREYVRIVSSLK